MYLNCIINTVFVSVLIFSDGQLVLEPSEPLTKAEGEDVAVFCTNVGSGPEQPEWVAPDGNLIGTINQGEVEASY